MLLKHCQFSKMIISLPFPNLKDKTLNEKIDNCIILMKYRFLNNSHVQICHHTSLTNNGNPIWKFFANDAASHLSILRLKIFISSIKSSMRKMLNIESEPPKRSRYVNQKSKFKGSPNVRQKNQSTPLPSGVNYHDIQSSPIPFSQNYFCQFPGPGFPQFVNPPSLIQVWCYHQTLLICPFLETNKYGHFKEKLW